MFAPKPFLCWCFRNISDDFWALDLKRVLRWNFGSFWGGSGNRKTDLGGFRQRKNGQQWKKTANTDVFKGFGMLEYWAHCKNQCFGPTLYWRTRKLCCFWRKDWNNTVRTCVLDRLSAQKCLNYVGVEGNQSKNTANNFLKHVQYLYKDWTKKLAVWAAPHAKRGEYCYTAACTSGAAMQHTQSHWLVWTRRFLLGFVGGFDNLEINNSQSYINSNQTCSIQTVFAKSSHFNRSNPIQTHFYFSIFQPP